MINIFFLISRFENWGNCQIIREVSTTIIIFLLKQTCLRLRLGFKSLIIYYSYLSSSIKVLKPVILKMIYHISPLPWKVSWKVSSNSQPLKCFANLGNRALWKKEFFAHQIRSIRHGFLFNKKFESPQYFIDFIIIIHFKKMFAGLRLILY